ncbi:MAG: hypothetical protein ACR2FN_03135 [Chitinophagaceae bacterium]
MNTITNEYMKQKIAETKNYCIVILKSGHNINMPGVKDIIWEHGRRNFSLKAEGLLPIVCPVNDGTEVNGIGIFNASVDEVKKIMDDDPGVKQGVFIYEIHPCRSFPGASLP